MTSINSNYLSAVDSNRRDFQNLHILADLCAAKSYGSRNNAEVIGRKRTLSQNEGPDTTGKLNKPEKENLEGDNIPTLTNAMLTEHFKRGVNLSRSLFDTTSMVFAVEDLHDKAEPLKVLKITDSPPPLKVLEAVQAIWENQASIHLTPTVLLGRIAVKSGSYLDMDNKMGGFVHPPRANQKKERWAYVYLMPRCNGDLKGLKAEGISVTEEAAIEVQRVATEELLDRRGIKPEDLKDINILTRPLTLEDRFRGKQILSYDYLQYTIGLQSYFLPVGKHLNTLCDYDQWTMTSVRKDYSHLLEWRLMRAPNLLAEIEKFKIIPPEHCRILSMN